MTPLWTTAWNVLGQGSIMNYNAVTVEVLV